MKPTAGRGGAFSFSFLWLCNDERVFLQANEYSHSHSLSSLNPGLDGEVKPSLSSSSNQNLGPSVSVTQSYSVGKTQSQTLVLSVWISW